KHLREEVDAVLLAVGLMPDVPRLPPSDADLESGVRLRARGGDRVDELSPSLDPIPGFIEHSRVRGRVLSAAALLPLMIACASAQTGPEDAETGADRAASVDDSGPSTSADADAGAPTADAASLDSATVADAGASDLGLPDSGRLEVVLQPNVFIL